MKFKSKLLAILLVITVAIALTGCNKNPEASKKFADSWYDQAGQSTIVKIKENDNHKGFNVQIVQSQTDTSEYLWKMNCEYNDETNELEYTDGKKILHTFDNKGNEDKKTEYKNGTGSFSLSDDRLFWDDEEDDAGGGCIFFRFSDVVQNFPDKD